MSNSRNVLFDHCSFRPMLNTFLSDLSKSQKFHKENVQKVKNKNKNKKCFGGKRKIEKRSVLLKFWSIGITGP